MSSPRSFKITQFAIGVIKSIDGTVLSSSNYSYFKHRSINLNTKIECSDNKCPQLNISIDKHLILSGHISKEQQKQMVGRMIQTKMILGRKKFMTACVYNCHFPNNHFRRIMFNNTSIATLSKTNLSTRFTTE